MWEGDGWGWGRRKEGKRGWNGKRGEEEMLERRRRGKLGKERWLGRGKGKRGEEDMAWEGRVVGKERRLKKEKEENRRAIEGG